MSKGVPINLIFFLLVNSKVTIEVSCEKVRKITSLRFSISNDDTKELIASGKAKVLLLVRS